MGSSLVNNGKIVSMPSNENYRNNSFWDKVDAKKKEEALFKGDLVRLKEDGTPEILDDDK